MQVPLICDRLQKNIPFRISSADIIQTSHRSIFYTIIYIFMNKTYTLLIGLLIVSCWAADCPVDASKQQKMVSDSVGLSAQDNKNSSNAQDLIYNYQFESPFSTKPSIAIGLNQIQSAPSSALDIKISNARTTQSGVYFQAQSGEQSNWKNIKINFLASTRDDIEIGTSSIKSPLVNPNDNTFNIVYNLETDKAASELKIKSFLQGINVVSGNNSQIGIKQESASVANRQVFFTYSSPLKFSIVRSLSITIIVFNIYTPGLLYADGTFDQNYVVSTLDVTIPRHGINELRTYIVGINSFETTAAKPISVYSSISEKFSLTIGPIDRNQIDYVSISYLILSVVDCGSCTGNPLLFDGLCQPNCPTGYKPFKGRCVPTSCPDGFTFNEKKQCVAICKGNEKYESGTCVCNENFYRINGGCAQCPAGFYYSFTSQSCKPLCGINSSYRDGRCYCKSGFYVINNRCQQCPYGTIYNVTSQSCYNICTRNEVYSPEGCVCANGYFKIEGVCGRCPYKRIYDPDTMTCVCGDGFELVYGSCVPACKVNEVRVEGFCTCAKNFILIDGKCGKCGANSSYSDFLQKCICNEGFTQYPAGCLPSCTDQQRLENGKCVDLCKQQFEVYKYGSCQCLPDYQRVDGVCVRSCLVYEKRDENGVCKCLPGYFKGNYPLCQLVNCPRGTTFDETKVDCISNCRVNEVYINGECVCRYGYNRANAYGDCVRDCASYQVSVNGFCECQPGYIRAAWGVCCPYVPAPGRCPPGSIFLFGQCRSPTKCGVNEYWCGSGCACVNGYYKVNGECVPVQPTLVCPANSQSNGVNCLCKPGFFPVVTGLCDRCPRDTFWNGYRCEGGDQECLEGWKWDNSKKYCVPKVNCKDNQVYDGVGCRCRQGLFFVEGECKECSPGTVFDGFRCSPGVPTNYCRDPFSFWDGYKCSCISGYWPLVDGKCIKCPDGHEWDGTCCKLRSGRPLPLTVAGDL